MSPDPFAANHLGSIPLRDGVIELTSLETR
jgi:hypothetical protein